MLLTLPRLAPWAYLTPNQNFEDLSLKNIRPQMRYRRSKLANICTLNLRTKRTTRPPRRPERILRSMGLVGASTPGRYELPHIGEGVWVRQNVRLLLYASVYYTGSWNNLFFAASRNIQTEQNGMYPHIFQWFRESTWQSATIDEKVDERNSRSSDCRKR